MAAISGARKKKVRGMIENENWDVGVLLYEYKMHFLKDRQYQTTPQLRYRSNLIIPATKKKIKNKREKMFQGENIVNKLMARLVGNKNRSNMQ